MSLSAQIIFLKPLVCLSYPSKAIPNTTDRILPSKLTYLHWQPSCQFALFLERQNTMQRTKTLLSQNVIRFTLSSSAFLISLALAGCGGGSDSSSNTSDTVVPLVADASLTSSSNQFYTLPNAGAIPSVPLGGSLNFRVRITDTSGLNITNKPPTVSVYNQDGTEFGSTRNLTLSTSLADVWTDTLTINTTQPGLYNGLKIVVVSATDNAGNQVTRPVGVYFYLNPR